MIDIHAHILPGIDDGAEDVYDTLEMARMAADSGVDKIIATPHCNIPGMYGNYFGREYIDRYESVVRAVRKEKIPIEILPGMEVFSTEDLPELIVNHKIMPLNQSRYILMEFAFDEDPEFADSILKRAEEVGARPVIAHAERYEFIQDYRRKYKEQQLFDKMVAEQKKIAKNQEIPSIESYTLQPNSMQRAFIYNLLELRNKSVDKALLISATGTGKTYASAFAMRELGFQRVLFLVHRNQVA